MRNPSSALYLISVGFKTAHALSISDVLEQAALSEIARQKIIAKVSMYTAVLTGVITTERAYQFETFVREHLPVVKYLDDKLTDDYAKSVFIGKYFAIPYYQTDAVELLKVEVDTFIKHFQEEK